MVMRTDEAGREAYSRFVESNNVQTRSDSQFYGSKSPQPENGSSNDLTVQQKADAKFYAQE